MKKKINKDNNRYIKIFGAREHNLKNISVQIPKDKLTVITGPSGSGKSSLALDVLYNEGKRRYIESLSSYARQFLGLPKKADIDSIEGLCPAIAIDQKTVGHNPRSTVGTITEIYDFMRILFARIGKLYCIYCPNEIKSQSSESISESIFNSFKDKNIKILSPIAKYKKGEFKNELEKLFTNNYRKFIINGQYYNFKSICEIKDLKLKKKEAHNIDVLIDNFNVDRAELSRLTEAIDKSFEIANNICKIKLDEKEYLYSADRICLNCNISFPEIEPRLFSFNSPIGACQMCNGIGLCYNVNYNLNYDNNTDVNTDNNLCNSCSGKRLNNLALSVLIAEKNIWDLSALSIDKLLEFFNNLILSKTESDIAATLIKEIITRTTFLKDVGLSYLSLNRYASTLSGGEGQRIRLATQIGSQLSGVLYILDEPSIGLHQKDNDALIKTLLKLRDLGNTLVVVEHDMDTMMQADYIIDMGPKAGILGGNVIAAGTPEQIMKDKNSLTGAYLSGKKEIISPKTLRKPNSFITLKNANLNNLKNLTVKIPLGVFSGISGVSGSGKSTLIMQELVPELHRLLENRRKPEKLLNSKIKNNKEVIQNVENIVVISQSPIGRTSRSNPATYLGIFNDIRNIYALLPESNIRGYKPGQFSFNVENGRCAKCNGNGTLTISMHFLPDVIITCDQCKGNRYSKETLEIKFKDKNIAEVLDMTVFEALQFFQSHSSMAKKLKFLCDVGLDYLKLGQSSTTLSGGEAQRVKLAYELSKRNTKTVYILDEPTTGLHSSDIEKLLIVLQKLVDKDNTVIVIEHNLDVLKSTDYIIDLGIDGGDMGGQIIATGTPKDIANNKNSYTGLYLKNFYS